MTGPEFRRQRLNRKIKQGVAAVFADLWQTDLNAFENRGKQLNPDKVSKLIEGLDAIPKMTHEDLVKLEERARAAFLPKDERDRGLAESEDCLAQLVEAGTEG
jgi:hypothetical protein